MPDRVIRHNAKVTEHVNVSVLRTVNSQPYNYL
jgi:hypothetical protein